MNENYCIQECPILHTSKHFSPGPQTLRPPSGVAEPSGKNNPFWDPRIPNHQPNGFREQLLNINQTVHTMYVYVCIM